jgi:ABC-type transport system substrate-binding protein
MLRGVHRQEALWARSADSATLDPAEVESGEDAKIIASVYDSLVTYKGDTVELEPKLAERWTFSPDGKTLTFDLRQGVTFHDGTPFDAASVVFTFERFLQPNHPHKPKEARTGPANDIAKSRLTGPQVIFTLSGRAS